MRHLHRGWSVRKRGKAREVRVLFQLTRLETLAELLGRGCFTLNGPRDVILYLRDIRVFREEIKGPSSLR
jgi:hypothetical protein